MKISSCFFIALSCLYMSSLWADSSVPPAQAKQLAAQLCVTCHGTDGISVIENYPILAGQREGYLVKQMKDFRDGIRKDPVMLNIVASLDDATISALAKYYASKKLP